MTDSTEWLACNHVSTRPTRHRIYRDAVVATARVPLRACMLTMPACCDAGTRSRWVANAEP